MNNKILGGQHGYVLELAPGAVTSDLIIVGNPIELRGNDHLLGLPQDVSHFSNVVIVQIKCGTPNTGSICPPIQTRSFRTIPSPLENPYQ
jgi:hypothetical protein